MRSISVVMFGLIISCSNPPPSDPCLIERSALTGVYAIETTEVDGDCGSVGSLDVDVENGIVFANSNAGCEIASEDWDQNSCTASSVHACDDGTWEMRLDWVVSSDPDNPEIVSGELTTYMSKWGGLYTCTSLYSFDGVRTDALSE